MDRRFAIKMGQQLFEIAECAECFLWDPAEPVATRPLMFSSSMAPALLYCHDGNKNVSDLVAIDGVVAAHYEYSPFGKVVMAASEIQVSGMPPHLLNPYRFSSECHDDALGLVYYNYRHYNPADGRWIGRDILSEVLLNAGDVTKSVWAMDQETSLYRYIFNLPMDKTDSFGACMFVLPFVLPEMLKTIFDSSWLNDLPDCPCSIPVDPSGCPDKDGAGDGWTSPDKTRHAGGSWEIRSNPTSSGAGQQCVYDSADNLINQGPGAGTPDRWSPSNNKLDDSHWLAGSERLYNFIRHSLADGWQWFLGTGFDHWTHPPNPGRDGNGNPCPNNDGSASPPNTSGSGCCND